MSWSLRSHNAGVGSPGLRGEVQRVERAGRNGGVLWLGDLHLAHCSPRRLPSSPKSMRRETYSIPIHSMVLWLEVSGNSSERNAIHHTTRREHKNLYQQLRKCSRRHSKTRQLLTTTATPPKGPEANSHAEAILWAQNWGLEPNTSGPSPQISTHPPLLLPALLLPGGNHQGSFCLSLKWELN